MENQTSINHQTPPFGKQMLADAVCRQLLFSTPMVNATFAGIKEMTRRTKGLEEINVNPDDWQFEWADFALKYPFRFTQKSSVNKKSLANRSFYQAEAKCPYGKIGDILWVRETTCYVMLDHAHDLLEGAKDNNQVVYKASVHPDWMEYAKEKYGYKWKPSIFMEKSACRLSLEIKNVRVERLQDITNEDCVKEGITPLAMSATQVSEQGKLFLDHSKPKQFFNDGLPPFWSFNSLWCSINGNDSWELNPWVWVISFKVVECPYGFR